MKALGVGLGACEFTDIEVRRAESGQPSVHLHGRAAELAAERGVTAWHLSLTHTGRRRSRRIAGRMRARGRGSATAHGPRCWATLD